MNRGVRWIAAGAGIAGAMYASYVAFTWARYGRRKPARGVSADALLDAFMPRYDVCERHAIDLPTPAEVTLLAAKNLDLDRSPLVQVIFRGRELILGSQPDTTTRPEGLLELTKSLGWGVVAETPREIVMGAVTRPWEPNPVFRALSPTEFAAFAEPGWVKIVWTLRADPSDDGGSTFRTETRAVATDVQARRKFRWYWSFLSPGIILIRLLLRRALPAEADRAWRLAGDDLLPDARGQFTHATTIAAPPADVWPWLVQMGCQRAGWYSWDCLDNAGRPSADQIVPELQGLAVGDVLPWKPVGTDGFKVLVIDPQRLLVFQSLGPQFEGTWAFVLERLPGERTRLVVRYRAAFPPSARMAVMLRLMSAVHGFMERKQLRTIKHHAERMNAPGICS
ncbi:MAG TPA: hypothetical protein VFI53_14690 [Myxococcaceae bacterium]|nr:hypothetical protein [Myxococcaceae bacterium]